jgi:hypothetical protein
MSRAAAVGLLLAAALTGTTYAQTTTPAVRDPNGLAVLQQAVNALGGTAAIGQIQDCTATGSMQASPGGGLTSGSFRWENSGREFRYENPSPSGLRIFASGHGKPALEDNGVVRAVGRQGAVGNFPPHLLPLMLLRALVNQNVSVQLLGPGVVGGRSAIRVKIALGASASRAGTSSGQQWFFDATSGLPLRVEYLLVAEGAPGVSVVAATEFGSYRAVSGIQIPFQIVTYVDGVQTSVVTLNSVVFNTGISSGDFDLSTGGAQ